MPSKNLDKEIRRIVHYLPVVEEQCRRSETHAVKVMLERLVGAGIDSARAKVMIALILSSHMERSQKEHRPFDYDAYVAELASLTTSNWKD